MPEGVDRKGKIGGGVSHGGSEGTGWEGVSSRGALRGFLGCCRCGAGIYILTVPHHMGCGSTSKDSTAASQWRLALSLAGQGFEKVRPVGRGGGMAGGPMAGGPMADKGGRLPATSFVPQLLSV